MADMHPLLWISSATIGTFSIYAFAEYASHKSLERVLNEYGAVRDFHLLSESRLEELVDRYVEKPNRLHLFPKARQERSSVIYHMTQHRQKSVPEVLEFSKTF